MLSRRITDTLQSERLRSVGEWSGAIMDRLSMVQVKWRSINVCSCVWKGSATAFISKFASLNQDGSTFRMSFASKFTSPLEAIPQAAEVGSPP
ncbi:hypothetical protein TcWFU_003051 [Taenia crassiceps]|uniref:Uncharacterized protein n=1 Tax=Taenia crassiceps TaxID=6207 RepID=A0ABR4QDC0_9CEST